MSLTSKDYEKIIQFSADISYPVKDARSHIQHKLEDYFGFDNTIFWYSDNEGNLRDPLNYRLSDQAMTDYLTEFQFYDSLHPTKNVELFREKKAIRLADMTSINQYESSPFYRSYLRKYGLHDEMVVTLNHQGVLVGAIGMAQKEDSFKYTANDRNTLNLISDVIASVIMHQIKNEETVLSKREQEVVELVKKGWTNQVIAEKLHISVNTVKRHLQNIYEKYSVNNKTQLVQKL
ncbi:LuxR C-terminal-related transcriptional regulator [Ureibacillus sp. NPDC094379]